MTDAAQPNQRRVRPWIAAFLTILGWGVGLYYARRTRAAIWMTAFSILIGLVVGLGFVAYVMTSKTMPLGFFNPNGFSTVDLINLALSAIVAIGVWVAVSKHQVVEKAGPVRLFGYVAIWLAPMLLGLILAMALRFTTIQPFHIPSGNMQPTLNVGDYVFVSKWSYGYSRYSFAPFEDMLPAGRWRAHAPVRGDIVVFRPASEPNRDFVMRTIGMPGDRIQMIDGVLHINGQSVVRESLGEQSFGAGDVPFTATAYQETLPGGVSYTTLDRGPSELDNTPVFVVPAGHYFMIGDDRDNSADSRLPSMVGFVPDDNLVGRVGQIFTPR